VAHKSPPGTPVHNHTARALWKPSHTGGTIQRAMTVAYQSNAGSIIALKITGRPNWSAQVTKKLKPQPGQVRGHAIEWNTFCRAFKNKWEGRPTNDLLAYMLRKAKTTETQNAIRNARNDGQVQHALVLYLKEEYNNLENLDINDESVDNLSGGAANTIAQELDKLKNPSQHLDQLKILFNKSFSPGLSGKGWGRFEKFKKTFALAWGVDKDTIELWAAEMNVPQSSQVGSAMDTGMEVETISNNNAIPTTSAPQLVFPVISNNNATSSPPVTVPTFVSTVTAPTVNDTVRLCGQNFRVKYWQGEKYLEGLQSTIHQLWTQGQYNTLKRLRDELDALNDRAFEEEVATLNVLLEWR